MDYPEVWRDRSGGDDPAGNSAKCWAVRSRSRANWMWDRRSRFRLPAGMAEAAARAPARVPEEPCDGDSPQSVVVDDDPGAQTDAHVSGELRGPGQADFGVAEITAGGDGCLLTRGPLPVNGPGRA